MILPSSLWYGGAARRWGARLAAVFALNSVLAPGVGGQVLTGRVLRDGRGVARAAVELHRVSDGSRGVVQTVTADAEGRFAVRLPPPADTGFTVYFGTSVVSGVRYFGPALHGRDRPPEYRIEVFDTTSASASADSVRLLRRDVILSPSVEGGWEVAELVRVLNPTRRTVVPAQEKPLVGLPLPAGSTAFQAGAAEQEQATDSTRRDVVKVGATAWIAAPLVPGERDFVFRYRLPASPKRVSFPVGDVTDSLSVYLRQPAPDAEVRGVPEVEGITAEGERFRRFAAAGVRPGADVALDWGGPAAPPVDPRWAGVGITLLVLGGGLWLAWRRPRHP